MITLRNISLFVMIMFLGCTTQKSDQTYPVSIFQVDSKNGQKILKTEVGKGIRYTVCKIEKVSQVEKVVLSGFSISESLKSELHNGCLVVYVPSKFTRTAGMFRMDAMKENELIHLTDLQLTPGLPTGKIESFAGPKSILPIDDAGSMITSFPQDLYGNATSSFDEFYYQVSKDDNIVRKNNQTEKTYPSLTVLPGRSPNLLIGGKVKDVATIKHNIRVLTGCPTSIKLYADGVYPYADGRQFFKVSTNILRDANQNMVEDGTEVQFIITNENGQLFGAYSSLVVNGKSDSWIKNPIVEGKYKVQAKICGNRSDSKAITFAPVFKDFQYSWENSGLIVGPLTGALGEFLSDGTSVEVTFQLGESVQLMTSQLIDGLAHFNTEDLWTNQQLSEAQVEIHGKSFTVKRIDL